jgi:ABC-type ATPase with predicted acetyltransferase domain
VGDVAELMGLGLEEVKFPVFVNASVEVEPGDVVYVTGESGGGKSLLVRHLASEMEKHPDFAPGCVFMGCCGACEEGCAVG